MPKQKTHSGAKKRFKVTGQRQDPARAAGKRHLLERKPEPLTRRLTGTPRSPPADAEDQEAAQHLSPAPPLPRAAPRASPRQNRCSSGTRQEGGQRPQEAP
jgi:large subunit ribosomal protein L35